MPYHTPRASLRCAPAKYQYISCFMQTHVPWWDSCRNVHLNVQYEQNESKSTCTAGGCGGAASPTRQSIMKYLQERTHILGGPAQKTPNFQMAHSQKKLTRIAECTHLMVVLKFRWKKWLLRALLAAESGVDGLSYCRGSTLSIRNHSVTFLVLFFFSYVRHTSKLVAHHAKHHRTSPINPTTRTHRTAAAAAIDPHCRLGLFLFVACEFFLFKVCEAIMVDDMKWHLCCWLLFRVHSLKCDPFPAHSRSST
jgi:hypothetical protein